VREFRPGLEARRLAIHRPEEIDGRLEAALFADERQRATFAALAAADTLREAIDGAPPDVAELLVRLTVEEPRWPADDVLKQLVRDATRRELTVLTTEARSQPAALEEAADVTTWMHSLDEPDASAEATERLVAWLVVRSETIGEGQRA
jgi:hypothetical protein